MPQSRFPFWLILLGVSLLSFPCVSHACEPIAVWMVAAGPQFLPMNLTAMILIVLAKAGAFSFFERRIDFWRACLLMLLANVFSSLIGGLVAGIFSISFFIFVSIPVLFFVSWFLAKRLDFLLGARTLGVGLLSLAPFVGLLFTGVFYFLGQEVLREDRVAEYWMLKVLSLIFPLVVGLLLTTLLEEWFIGKCVKRIKEGFLMPVLKANLVAFLLGAGIGAAFMLPKRLHSPGFLAMVMDFLSGMVV